MIDDDPALLDDLREELMRRFDPTVEMLVARFYAILNKAHAEGFKEGYDYQKRYGYQPGEELL